MITSSKISDSRSRIFSVFTLVALATVMPELFSGSTPPSGFVNPGLLIFLTLGYGVAVLLVRELAVRWSSGPLGIFFLGLGYSIFNEGLLAKTLIVEQSLPINQYDHYGYCLGISWPWMAGIGGWHACASVMFPVAFTHHLFPGERARPWLKAKVALGIGVVLLFLSTVVFLGTSEKGIKGSPRQLALLLGVIGCTLLAGRALKARVREPEPGRSRLLPLVLGFSVVIPFWTLVVLASAKVPLAVFFAALIGIVLLYASILDRRHWLMPPAFLFFAIGWYLHNVLQALLFIGAAAGNPARALATGITDAVILFFLFRQARLGGLVPLQAG